MSSVKLVSITPDAEKFIAWAARRSSDNPDNPEYDKLFQYLINHNHWSPFEQAHASFEITTSRAIAAQILRHRSFCFQERSQRYTDEIIGFETSTGRRQATKNRQSSTNDLGEATLEWWDETQSRAFKFSKEIYELSLSMGVCREQARMLLPLATQTNLVMTGNIRSWIHYVKLRCAKDTQQEHRQIAEDIQWDLSRSLPSIATALGWEKHHAV